MGAHESHSKMYFKVKQSATGKTQVGNNNALEKKFKSGDIVGRLPRVYLALPVRSINQDTPSQSVLAENVHHKVNSGT